MAIKKKPEVKKKIEIPLSNKALEFIQVTQEILNVDWPKQKKNKVTISKHFVHYSRIQFNEKDVEVIGLGPIKETHKQITELIVRMGII